MICAFNGESIVNSQMCQKWFATFFLTENCSDLQLGRPMMVASNQIKILLPKTMLDNEGDSKYASHPLKIIYTS